MRRVIRVVGKDIERELQDALIELDVNRYRRGLEQILNFGRCFRIRTNSHYVQRTHIASIASFARENVVFQYVWPRCARGDVCTNSVAHRARDAMRGFAFALWERVNAHGVRFQ